MPYLARAQNNLRDTMTRLILNLIFFTLFVCLLHEAQAEPSNFVRSEALADYYHLTWEVDFARKNITFEVKAQTTGYVGFGVNTIGGMKGGDIVIGGVYDNGTSYFSDRHGVGSYLPPVDKSQDWFLLEAHEADGWTTLKFYRGFNPCDQEEDLQLTNDTSRVIFSVGATDNLSYHEKRGTKSIILLSPPSPPVDVSKFESWRITVSTEIPPVDTAYWVTIHKSPKFNSKTHMVGFQVRIENELADKYTHHLLLHRCYPLNGANLTEVLGPWVGQPGGINDKPEITAIRKYCSIISYAWAKGGSPLILPEHVGLPIGEMYSEEYFLLEIHYDNPTVDVGVQYETGVTIYYTNDLRENDAGILFTGVKFSPNHLIPPNVEDFVLVGHCSSDCTSQTIPSEGINVVSVLLHAHLNGRRIRARHFRGGQELSWIANDDNYDFNYQQDRPMINEVKILPGDHLSVECNYDSTWNNPPTAAYGGESTHHEMCQAFLLYYPLLRNLDVCVSIYDSLKDVYQPLGIEEIDLSKSSEYPVVVAPESMKGLTLLEALNTKVNWTESRIEHLRYQMRWAMQMGICLEFTSGQSFNKETTYPNATTYEPAFSCE